METYKQQNSVPVKQEHSLTIQYTIVYITLKDEQGYRKVGVGVGVGVGVRGSRRAWRSGGERDEKDTEKMDMINVCACEC